MEKLLGSLRKWAAAVGFARGVFGNTLNCQSKAGLLMQSSSGTDGNFGATVANSLRFPREDIYMGEGRRSIANSHSLCELC